MKSPEAFAVTAGDINIYHARLIADQQITLVLEFSESLDIGKLTTALAVLHEALPILSSVIRLKGSRLRRVRISGYQAAVSVVSEPADWAQEIVRFIGSPCDPEREPPAKLLLLRKNGEDTLCFKIDHLLSDAAGLSYLLSLFAEAYTEARISQAINHDRGFGQVFRRFSPITLVRSAWKANLPTPGPALVRAPFEVENTFIEHVFLERGQFEGIESEAKRRNATINDVLLAGLYQAIFKHLTPGDQMRYPVMVPVDMRRYLPEGQRGVIANLSSAVFPSLARIPNESFRGTLDRVKACMDEDELKQDYPGLGAMTLMVVGALWGGKILRKKYRQAVRRDSRFFNYTNFGIMDETHLAFEQISIKQAYGVGPIQYAPGILIALSTYRSTLHLVVQGRGDEQFQNFVRQFLGAILSGLANIPGRKPTD